MTEPEAPIPFSDEPLANAAGEPAAVATAPADEAHEQPQSEPWTPARVSEWNAYYDLYVMLSVLFLVFVVSTVRVDEHNPLLWTHLKAGELAMQQSAPVVTDPFSFSQGDARWVNVPWLFQWSHAAIYKLVRDLVPSDPADPTANQGSAEQIAIGSLIALGALARVLTAWVMLSIRRPGPGLWWSAVCVTLALGAIAGPLGLLPGGIAGPGLVSPSTWGLLLQAIELLLLHWAFNEGRQSALYALIPLFLVWANLDESFFAGLLILAAAAIGRLLAGQSADRRVAAWQSQLRVDSAEGGKTPRVARPVAAISGLIVLGLCVAVCFANPSTYRVFEPAVRPFLSFFGSPTEMFKLGEMSYFGKHLQKQFGSGWYVFPAYYSILVGLGLCSFLLNARRFAWSRFLPFVVLSVIWGLFMGFRQEFSVVFATVLALNGQEWYHDRFGTEGRLGFNWTLWSTGGRLVTLAAIFACVSAAITGWNKSPEEPRFGLTFDPNDFPFEAAEYLARRDDIKGNVLNTTAAQGDALIWKAYPTRRSFIDGRGFFAQETLEEHRRLRLAIRDDDTAVWKEGLDRHNITAVMIEPSSARETYARLTQSPHWIPFYDDGRVVIFGRGDAHEPDLATFETNRLDPETRAFRVEHTVPPADRPPTPTTWMDDIFRNRLLGQRQSHTSAAARWLQGTNPESDQPNLPDPARCLLAIQEARTAVAKNPDDWLAYRLLNASYRLLAQQESALLSGIALTHENQAKISQIVPGIDLLNTRFRQRMTALVYAVETTPPPRTLEARRELENLNLELYQLYRQAGFHDLARDRLQTVIRDTQTGDVPPELVAQYHLQLDQLNERIRKIEDHLIDLQTERQAGPIEKAAAARNQGAPGMAIAELEEANRGNMSPAVVKPQLVDLYCATGQPERALELLNMGALDDPHLGTEPGASFLRQGQIYLLLGNYQTAATLWQTRAIPKLRLERCGRAFSMGQILRRGELVAATNIDLSIPTLINRQATWLYELGLCQLEAGMPESAAESFASALKLAPEIPVRPIIAYYLEHLGKPASELPKKAKPAIPAPSSVIDRLKTTSPISAVKPAEAPAGSTIPASGPADSAKLAPAGEAVKEKDRKSGEPKRIENRAR